jgi:hypothetical protein
MIDLSQFSSDFPEQGDREDLKILSEHVWLHNTEVKYRIELRRGRWYLTMLYVAIENALRFVCKRIDHYDSEKKARIYADIFKRAIQKDNRGTQKLKPNAIHLNDN